jgi:putative ABC transport system permease protein
VLPQGFRFPDDLEPEILVAARLAAQPEWGAQRVGLLRAGGRLREGVALDGVARELSAILARHEPERPAFIRAQRKESAIEVVPLQQRLVGDTRPAFLVSLGAVGLLLLIACVNVASLQLGRAAVRQREIGLRAALGASRARIARSLVVENLVLSVLAGVAGVLVAVGLLHGLRMFPGLPIGAPSDLRMTWLLGGAALLLGTVCGLAIGVVPALTGPKVDLNELLKAGSRSLVGGGGTRVRSILVSAQVALALILLLGSGLLLRSLQNVLTVDPGFESEGVLTARLILPGSRYSSLSERATLSRSLVEKISALPEVAAAGTTNSLPLTGYSLRMSIAVEGQPQPRPEEIVGAPVSIVTPGYFRAMGMRLLSGRPFDERDRENGSLVAVASESFTRRFFSSEDVVGKRVRVGGVPSGQPSSG